LKRLAAPEWVFSFGMVFPEETYYWTTSFRIACFGENPCVLWAAQAGFGAQIDAFCPVLQSMFHEYSS